jgi:membrane-associated protein
MNLFSSDNLVMLIKAAGYLGIALIVFAESGLLVGFVLPGDSLLFTAGFLSSQKFLDIYFLIPLIFVAALLGDNVGYYLGHKAGKKILNSEKQGRFFKKENLEKAEDFYKRHGGKTMIFARFIPFVRTFAPVLAGVGRMRYNIFLLFDIIGALLWSAIVTLAGFFLGDLVPNVDQYILLIIFGIIILSLLPSAVLAARQQILKYLKKRRSQIS